MYILNPPHEGYDSLQTLSLHAHINHALFLRGHFYQSSNDCIQFLIKDNLIRLAYKTQSYCILCAVIYNLIQFYLFPSIFFIFCIQKCFTEFFQSSILCSFLFHIKNFHFEPFSFQCIYLYTIQKN